MCHLRTCELIRRRSVSARYKLSEHPTNTIIRGEPTGLYALGLSSLEGVLSALVELVPAALAGAAEA